MQDLMTKCPKCKTDLEQLADADRDIAHCPACGKIIKDCLVIPENISMSQLPDNIDLMEMDRVKFWDGVCYVACIIGVALVFLPALVYFTVRDSLDRRTYLRQAKNRA